MYNASATPITATSATLDPLAIAEDAADTEKPVVFNIAGLTDESGSDDTETYDRGKTDASAAMASNAKALLLFFHFVSLDTKLQ